MNQSQLHDLANLLQNSLHTVVLTGAGISVESRVPTFRGENGLWEEFRPDEYATLTAFNRDPGKCWKMFLRMLDTIRNAAPNPAHRALAELERNHLIAAVITQNIDGLHQAAGQRTTIELHGSIHTVTCQTCHEPVTTDSITVDPLNLPPRCRCGGVFKPDVILFEEPLHSDRFIESFRHVQRCSVLMLIGTSGFVHPANRFPEIAHSHGATIVDINPTASLTTRSLPGAIEIRESAPAFLDRLLEHLKGRASSNFQDPSSR